MCVRAMYACQPVSSIQMIFVPYKNTYTKCNLTNIKCGDTRSKQEDVSKIAELKTKKSSTATTKATELGAAAGGEEGGGGVRAVYYLSKVKATVGQGLSDHI